MVLNWSEMRTSELKEHLSAVTLAQAGMNKDASKKEVVIDSANLPLNIVYKGRRYILILTKNDKLILNKNTD